jgi:two-component system sensor histidine kinase and response regulator WspE
MQSELEHSLEPPALGPRFPITHPAVGGPTDGTFCKGRRNAGVPGDRLAELDHYDRRSAHLSSRLYFEVLRTRMQPFQDGTRRFPRMVLGTLSQALGKTGAIGGPRQQHPGGSRYPGAVGSPLDPPAPNAVDHVANCPRCVPPPANRRKPSSNWKPATAPDSCWVSVSDDGAGLDTNRLRRVVVEKQLTTLPLAERYG